MLNEWYNVASGFGCVQSQDTEGFTSQTVAGLFVMEGVK